MRHVSAGIVRAETWRDALEATLPASGVARQALHARVVMVILDRVVAGKDVAQADRWCLHGLLFRWRREHACQQSACQPAIAVHSQAVPASNSWQHTCLQRGCRMVLATAVQEDVRSICADVPLQLAEMLNTLLRS
jgi:hypothetical protein